MPNTLLKKMAEQAVMDASTTRAFHKGPAAFTSQEVPTVQEALPPTFAAGELREVLLVKANAAELGALALETACESGPNTLEE